MGNQNFLKHKKKNIKVSNNSLRYYETFISIFLVYFRNIIFLIKIIVFVNKNYYFY
jgi:hypothetical protein